MDSGSEFWRTVSDKPFADIKADAALRNRLAGRFLRPNPSSGGSSRTPHRQRFSNDVTQWLARELIRTPMKIMQGRDQLMAQNPNYFRKDDPLAINAIDSLCRSRDPAGVLVAHWAVGHTTTSSARPGGFTNKASMWISGEGDGVVSLASAEVDGVKSQIVVPADHLTVHRYPQSILEFVGFCWRTWPSCRRFEAWSTLHAGGHAARRPPQMLTPVATPAATSVR